MPGKDVIDMNNSLIDAQFKDASPTKTVERIKEILSSHKIKAIESWSESGVEHCFSLRVNIAGTNFGTNGKGLTKEFALASAYGELMERMQLGLFGDSSVQKLGYFNYAIGANEAISAEQLYNELPSWYDYLAKRINSLDNEGIDGKALLSRFVNSDNKIESVKFYNLMNGRTVLVPRDLRCIVCGSNGGAAGNSMEEAIVQAISEIVERHYKLKILSQQISLPDIPEGVLKNYPTAYKIIENVRNKGFRVIVKDCSLGTAFPVVCVCYINEKTGKYHTHFGAYPVLEIALERTLTESFQGRNIDDFTKNQDFIYSSMELFSYKNVYRDLKKGDYLKTPMFFIGECKHQYNEGVGFSGKNNAELLSQLIEFFDKQGLEIFVRDASSLGFPTYNVFIPTYSEILFHSLSKKHFSSFSYTQAAIKTLRNLKDASFDDYLLLLLHIDEMKKLSTIDNRLFNFANCANLMLDRNQNLNEYLMSSSLAYVYYAMGNLTQALSFLEKMIPLAGENDTEYLLCLKRYLAMLVNNYNENDANRLVKFFHKETTISRLFSYIDNGLNPFEKFVLSCDCVSCDACIIKDICKQKYTQFLINLVNENSKMLSFEAFTNFIKKYSLK